MIDPLQYKIMAKSHNVYSKQKMMKRSTSKTFGENYNLETYENDQEGIIQKLQYWAQFQR